MYKNIEILNEINDVNKIDLTLLNTFLIEKGDIFLDALLQVENFKEININNEKLQDYYLNLPEHRLDKIPKILFKNRIFTENLISKDGEYLYYVPEEFKNYSLCKKAVYQNPMALYSVPEKLKNYSLCKKAVSVDEFYCINNRINYVNKYRNLRIIPIKYFDKLIKDFPEKKQGLIIIKSELLNPITENIIKEYISKEVRNLLKETLFTKKKLL